MKVVVIFGSWNFQDVTAARNYGVGGQRKMRVGDVLAAECGLVYSGKVRMQYCSQGR